MLTRVNGARDFCKGFQLKKFLLGGGNQLELHHIFPKSQLYKYGGFGREEVNAIANFAFLTKDCNASISAKLPEDYFPYYEAKHPGVLTSHWIPMDEQLWKIENYRDFPRRSARVAGGSGQQLPRPAISWQHARSWTRPSP